MGFTWEITAADTKAEMERAAHRSRDKNHPLSDGNFKVLAQAIPEANNIAIPPNQLRDIGTNYPRELGMLTVRGDPLTTAIKGTQRENNPPEELSLSEIAELHDQSLHALFRKENGFFEPELMAFLHTHIRQLYEGDHKAGVKGARLHSHSLPNCFWSMDVAKKEQARYITGAHDQLVFVTQFALKALNRTSGEADELGVTQTNKITVVKNEHGKAEIQALTIKFESTSDNPLTLLPYINFKDIALKQAKKLPLFAHEIAILKALASHEIPGDKITTLLNTPHLGQVLFFGIPSKHLAANVLEENENKLFYILTAVFQRAPLLSRHLSTAQLSEILENLSLENEDSDTTQELKKHAKKHLINNLMYYNPRFIKRILVDKKGRFDNDLKSTLREELAKGSDPADLWAQVNNSKWLFKHADLATKTARKTARQKDVAKVLAKIALHKKSPDARLARQLLGLKAKGLRRLIEWLTQPIAKRVAKQVSAEDTTALALANKTLIPDLVSLWIAKPDRIAHLNQAHIQEICAPLKDEVRTKLTQQLDSTYPSPVDGESIGAHPNLTLLKGFLEASRPTSRASSVSAGTGSGRGTVVSDSGDEETSNPLKTDPDPQPEFPTVQQKTPATGLFIPVTTTTKTVEQPRRPSMTNDNK